MAAQPKARIVVLALAAMTAAACAGVLASGAHALPFHGFNAIQWPCTPEEAYPGTNCVDGHHYRLPLGEFVYRFRSDAECARDRARALGSGTWNFDRENKAIDAMRQLRPGAEPFMVLTSGPNTPANDCGGYKMPTTNTELTDWYWFVRAATQNALARNVQDLEIWNEPNARQYNGGSADPNAYGNAYCFASAAVRDQGGSSIRLHLGGIADDGTDNPYPAYGYGAKAWLGYVKTGLQLNCNGNYRVDGVSHHFYPTSSDPAGELGRRTQVMRSAINNTFGYTNQKLLMVTEVGYVAYNSFGTVDNNLTSSRVSALLENCWANRHRDYIRACYSWTLQEVPGQPRSDYGLLTSGLSTAKPVWTAWNNAVRGHTCLNCP
jgi:hypothetical protein